MGRMDEIRERLEAHERGVKGAAHDDEASDLRFLLSEIDRLKAKLEGEDMSGGPRCYYCGRFLPYLPRPEGDEDDVVTVKVRDYAMYDPPEYRAAHRRCAKGANDG